MVAAITIGHGKPVIEKAHIEFTGFKDAADFLEEIRRQEIRARLRVPPGTGVIRAVLRLHEADKMHLPHGLFPTHFQSEFCTLAGSVNLPSTESGNPRQFLAFQPF
jgi:hypothetical protein